MSRQCLAFLLMVCHLLLPNTAPAGQLTGRLFTTPAERAKLNFLRKISKPLKEVPLHDSGALNMGYAVPDSVAVQGYVTRSDGKQGTVWVNNVPVRENSESAGLRVGKLPHDGNQVQINLSAVSKTVSLKAGQVYVTETDTISEHKAQVSNERLFDRQDAEIAGAGLSERP
jgi:hypothetical protein